MVCRTQSAVSQQIKALEDELECQLFLRIGKRKLVTSDEGKRLYEFTQKLLDEIDNTLEDIHAISGGNRGHVSISAPFTTCFQVLPEIIKRFADQHPKVIVSVFDQPQEKAIAMVRDGDKFTQSWTAPFVNSRHLIRNRFRCRVQKVSHGFYHLFYASLGLIVPIGHPLLKYRNISIKDIAGQDLIVSPSRMRHSGRLMLEKYAQKSGIALKVS